MVDYIGRDISLGNLPNILICNTEFNSSAILSMDRAPYSNKVVLIEDESSNGYTIGFDGGLTFSSEESFTSWFFTMGELVAQSGAINVYGRVFNYFGGTISATPTLTSRRYFIRLELKVIQRP